MFATSSPSPVTPAAAPADFVAALTAHLPAMRAAAMRFTRDSSLAADLAHDTAERALRQHARFLPGSNFRAWIQTVMAHTFINRYRRQRRERTLLEGARRLDVLAQLRSEAASEAAAQPERHILQNMLSDTVVQALAAMPEAYRRVVLLCDVEGLSYRDASGALGCPMGTIMSRLHRGRRLLKQQLGTEARALGIGQAGAASGAAAATAVAA